MSAERATKTDQRLAAREALGGLRARERHERAGRLRGHLLASDVWRLASVVMVFAADDQEPDLDPLLEMGFLEGKTVCVPEVDWASKEMTPRRVRRAGDLVAGRHGVRVPRGSLPAVNPHDVGLVLVPGVAFDRAGGRLGRGGGFYDRFLSAWRGALPMETDARARRSIGIGFECQVIERVRAEAHDQRLDGLATEAGLELFGAG